MDDAIEEWRDIAEREERNASRWAGDLESLLQRLGLPPGKVDDAAARVHARLDQIADELRDLRGDAALRRRVEKVVAALGTR